MLKLKRAYEPGTPAEDTHPRRTFVAAGAFTLARLLEVQSQVSVAGTEPAPVRHHVIA